MKHLFHVQTRGRWRTSADSRPRFRRECRIALWLTTYFFPNKMKRWRYLYR